MRLHCTGWCAQDVTSAVRSCHVLGHSVNRSRPKPFQSEKHTHAGDCPQFQFGHRGSRVITLAASTVAVGQEVRKAWQCQAGVMSISWHNSVLEGNTHPYD